MTYPHTIARGPLVATISHLRSGGYSVRGQATCMQDCLRLYTAAEEPEAHRAANYFTHAGFIPADQIPTINKKQNYEYNNHK